MTEVPDKQTEGTGTRGRGRGRGRLRPDEAEPVAARRRTTRSSGVATPAAASNGNGSLTVLPGEKLARVVATPGEDLEAEELTPLEAEAGAEAVAEGQPETEEASRRRRRRRGGRGRGRGRGREGEGLPAGEAGGPVDAASDADEPEDVEGDGADEIAANPQPRGPRPTPFGSVWDSQLGVPSRQAPAAVGPVSDDDDFEEPEIPEYLIAEQRGRQQAGRGGGGFRGGARGGRSAYTAAIDRERYGRGGGGGINRYPDVSGRDRDRPVDRQPSRGRDRQDAGFGRQERVDRPAPRSGDPWTEVPPEIEEMLRAQLAQSPKARRPEPAAQGVVPGASEPATAAPAPKRRTSTRTKPAASSRTATAPTPAADATANGTLGANDPPKRRTATRKKAEPGSAAASGEAAGDTASAPKRRTAVRTKTAAPEPAASASGDGTGEAAPKRRTTRKKAEPA